MEARLNSSPAYRFFSPTMLTIQQKGSTESVNICSQSTLFICFECYIHPGSTEATLASVNEMA